VATTWSSTDLTQYIEVHLAYELKYLLVGATTWSAVEHPADRAAWPDHLVVMAMDSAFVHARNLTEFMTLDGRWKGDPPKRPARSPHAVPALPVWSEYCESLHMKLLHPDPLRPYQPGGRGRDDLKDRVVDVASDVLTGWDDITAQAAMGPHRLAMEEARAQAVRDATGAAQRLGVAPVFS
jgi:hypothetical protein